MDVIAPAPASEDVESGPGEGPITYFQYRTWVDQLIGDEVSAEMVGRATIVSLIPVLAGFVVAVAAGEPAAYLQSPSTYLVGAGILVTTLTYGWGSRQFLSLWHRIDDAFAIDESEFHALVTGGLDRVYDDRAIFLEFLAGLVLIMSLQQVAPIPAAIPVGFEPIGELLGVTVRYADVIQHLVGVVVLLYVVTGIHMATTALWLLYRVTQLPLEGPRIAAMELEPVADFSAIAATMWFLLVVLIVLVYQPIVEYLLDLGGALDLGIWVGGSVVAFVLVGAGIFLVPLLLIHSALVRAKRERLLELDAELESVVREFETDERGSDGVSTALALYDRRRERVRTTRTWLIDLRGVAHMVGSGIAAALSMLTQVVTLPWV